MMLWASNAAGEVVLLNHSWRAFRGLPASAQDREAWVYGVHRSERRAARAAYAAAHRSKGPLTERYRVKRSDGVFRWVSDGAAPWFDVDGEFIGLVGCCVELDAPPHGSSTHPAHTDLATLIEASQDMVYRLGLVPSLTVEYIGGNVEAITGHPASEFYTDPHTALRALHPDDAPRFAWMTKGLKHARETFTHRWVHADGRIVWTEDHSQPVYDDDGQLIAIEGVARDVTARIESERKLRQSEEQLRQLTRRLETAREEERTDVARELHDEVGQTLTALKIEINRAVSAFGSAEHSVNAINRLQSVVGLVDFGIATVKRLSSRLRPATLDHFGLAEAIRWEGVTFKARTGIRCRVVAPGRRSRLSMEQQTALFRIAQEALNNVVCHARASAVRIVIKELASVVEFRIHDNGRGITPAEASAPESLGLRGMRERAALVGGTFSISGQRGTGSTVTVVVPLAQRDKTDGRHRQRRDSR